ncbi:MAG: hypothetical protein NTZ56_24105 [Acidobacteria bacterium]|nr:hypothetical protein [Acidobacteriota bacterium]
MVKKRSSAPLRSVRQSVTMPGALAAAVRRVAEERQVTMSRALVALAERGVAAEAEAKQQLEATYHRFISERDPEAKNAAGRELIESIFGQGAIAEDSVR